MSISIVAAVFVVFLLIVLVLVVVIAFAGGIMSPSTNHKGSIGLNVVHVVVVFCRCC